MALIASSRDAMRQAIDSLMHGESSLIETPAFRSLRADLGARSDLVAYVSGEFARGFFSGDGDDGWRGALVRESTVRAAGISIAIGKDGLFRERVRVLVPGLSTTLVGEVFGSRPAAIASAGRLPAGFPFYVGASFSHSDAVWEHLPGWLASVTGQDPARVRGRLLGLEEFLGIDIRRDLLGVMGDELALAFDPGPGKPFVLALRPSNQGAARRLLGRLDGLARAAEVYVSSTGRAGPITTYEYPRLAPMRPSYVFEGDELLIADSPEPLARVSLALGDPGSQARGDAGALTERPAHLALVADTEHAISWIRELAGGPDERRSGAWLQRLRDLLPGVASPLPPLQATFVLTREGISGEWSAPLSPVILTSLLIAAPGSDESPLLQAPAPPEGERDEPGSVPEAH
jgi:hypothetical protein